MTPPPPTQAITPAPAAATRVDRRRWTIIGLGYLVVAALAFSAGLAWHRAPAAGPRAVESQLTEAASAFRGPSPGCDLPQGAVQSAPVPISVTSGGQTRGGRLIAGPPASPDTPRILVVDLPDRGEQIDDHAAATNLDAIAATQHLVVATLTAQDGPGEWNSDHVADRSDDLRFVDDVIDQEASTACIDLDRVVIAGRGTGAQMATAYACTRPARVGALVVVAQPSLPAGCAVSPPVTTLMIQPPSADVVHSWIDAYLCTPGEAQTTAPLTVTVYGGCRNSMSLTVAEVADAGATWPPEGAPVVERFLANLGG
jgi:pimeloyl-ACP methyl ester carboxylesterase